jgi:hypothetical protein
MQITFATILESARNLGYGIERCGSGYLIFNLAHGPEGGGVVLPSALAIRRMLLTEIQNRLSAFS